MDLLNLLIGIAFLIARFGFGVLMLGVGVVSIVSAVQDYRLPYKKHTSDVLGIVLMCVVGYLCILFGVLALTCVTLDISI